MIKRLIFDVDNTLITNVDFELAIKETLNDLNLLSDDRVEQFKIAIKQYEKEYDNYNKNDYIMFMEKRLNCKLPSKFLECFFEHLKNLIPNYNIKLVETIEKLSLKYELVLLTNYFSESQLNRLNNMGIGKYFTSCYGEHKIKPYPEAYIAACGINEPQECIMIGDDIYLDIECAKKLGINTIYINNKNNTEKVTSISVEKVEDINENMIEQFNKK